jgi:lipoic acid synthetase
MEMNRLLDKHNVNTVCNSALCPNRGECFSKKIATFMILGDKCTRNCKFCGIEKGRTEVDKEEPQKIAIAVKKLGLNHVIITSVTRDDLPDYGCNQFVKTIKKIKELNKSVEVLIPDFNAREELLAKIVKEKPEIISHNIECVERISGKIAYANKYEQSIKVLKILRKLIDKEKDNIFLKSGFMVGLGETDEEIFELINQLKEVGCDMITIGQYLKPTKNHWPEHRYLSIKKFSEFREYANSIGIRNVESGPFVRSSYHSKMPITHKFLKLRS